MPKGAIVPGRTTQETETARLAHERDEALLREAANAEILRLISRSPGDLELVFRTILEHATRICNAHFGTLFRFDGENLYPTAQFNTPAALLEAQTRRASFRPLPGSAFDHLVRTKQVIQLADVAAEGIPSLAATLGGARSLVAVPMLKDDALIGTILIYHQEVRPFTDKQIELVKNFAAQAVIAIENARLLTELRQRTTDLTESLEQQTATANVLRVISSSPGELGPVFDAVLDSATRLCEANFGILYRYEGDAFLAIALRGAPPAFAEFQQRAPIHPTPASGLGRIVSTQQPVHIIDTMAEQRYLDGDPYAVTAVKLSGSRTLIFVPMLKDDDLIGAITIYRREVRPFTDKQIELLQNFAAQAVIAIENARLLSELRQSLEQQTATADVLGVISSSPGELNPVFKIILENATRICEAKFGTLYLTEGDGYRTVAMHNVPSAFAEFIRQRGPFKPPPGIHLDRVMRTKQVSHTADYAAEATPGAAATLGGARSLVCVPMLKDDTLIGAITIYRQEVRPFTDKQIALVQNFAAQAVIAIENTRLLNELRESLQQQTATADVLKVISTSPGELEPVFQAMLENAVRICEAKFGTLFRFEGDAYRAVATHNAPQELMDEYGRHGLRQPTPGGILDRMLRTKQVCHTADYAAESVHGTAARFGGARSIVCVPMLKDNVLIGAFSIYRQEVRPFTGKQIALLENFAAQAVIAIENARLLNELRESLQQQTATADVLKIISRSTFES
jgi:GAF domain-containing protein